MNYVYTLVLTIKVIHPDLLKKVPVIKYLRNIMAGTMGLKEAKDAAEAMVDFDDAWYQNSHYLDKQLTVKFYGVNDYCVVIQNIAAQHDNNEDAIRIVIVGSDIQSYKPHQVIFEVT